MTGDPMTEHQRSNDGDVAKLERLHRGCEAVRRDVGQVVLGQDETIDLLLVALLADGHAILEGVPGLAKSLLVQTISRCLSLSFARIQFTPDLMPSDITGTEVMFEDKATGNREFRFLEGPIFHHIVLGDEINRTPPKTQAALLEAMQERQVSAGGIRHALPKPFFVLATQNPIEQEGTYALPEAQLDRFLVKAVVRYPAREIEREVYRRAGSQAAVEPKAAIAREELLEMQDLVRRIPTNDVVLDYAVSLLRATRPGESDAPDFVRDWIQFGAGPRAGQALIACARARAALAGRPEVDVDDVRALLGPVLRHRLVLTFAAEAASQTTDTILEKLLATIPVRSQGAVHAGLRQVLRS
jgi:MoxR-like ATPase